MKENSNRIFKMAVYVDLMEQSWILYYNILRR